jgi:DNA invertase Pin-like site-specific DNA recombinase
MGKVFAYTRVSTVKQGEKGVSLQEQKDAILRYAIRNNLGISRWFEERETASKQGRPAFSEMLKLLRLRAAEGVIIHKIDRSARNLDDWVGIGKLVDAGVEIYFANESVDLKTVAGRLSADIQAVVAAHYSRNLREETRKGIYGRLKQGFYPLRAPIGYLDQGAAKPKLPDPAMAPLVKETFELYATGKISLPELANHMYERGLRNRHGGPVTVNGLSTLLNNPFYIGIMRIKKTGDTFTGNHPPLLNRALFEQIQAILRGKTVDRTSRHEFLFSRLVRCASCRYSLIGERKKGHVYYRCHNRPFKTPPVCPMTAIREELLDQSIRQTLDTITLSDRELLYLREQIEPHHQRAEEERKQQVHAARLQLDSLRTRVSRLTDLFLDGSLQKTVFEEKQKAYVWEEAELKQKLTLLENGSETAFREVEKFVELLKSPQMLYKQADHENKRELLRILLSDLTVSGKNVSLALRIPFRLVAEREKTSLCGPYRGTCRTTANLLQQLIKHFTEQPAY